MFCFFSLLLNVDYVFAVAAFVGTSSLPVFTLGRVASPNKSGAGCSVCLTASVPVYRLFNSLFVNSGTDLYYLFSSFCSMLSTKSYVGFWLL